MEFEERRLLYRAEYDILTIDRRRALLEDAGRENGMEVIGFRRFERWGVYTYTAEFAIEEDRYVFVPGTRSHSDGAATSRGSTPPPGARSQWI